MIIMRNPERAGLNLDTVDRLLTTTRAVRKRIDRERPVEPEVVEECLRLASQAPSGGNNQRWRWMVVVDADKKKVVAGYYTGEDFKIAPRRPVEEITYWDTWKAVR
jgi:nitroreductase